MSDEHKKTRAELEQIIQDELRERFGSDPRLATPEQRAKALEALNALMESYKERCEPIPMIHVGPCIVDEDGVMRTTLFVPPSLIDNLIDDPDPQ
jgi:hypothetical protein